MAVGAQPQMVDDKAVGLKFVKYGQVASQELAVVAPCRQDQPALFGAADDVGIVLVADDIMTDRDLAQVLGVGCSEGKEVDDDDATVAPIPREADHAPDGRIVFQGVGCRRV